jgi:hypothetical protein
LKIEEFLESLPQNIVSGDEVQLPDKSFREIFNFVDLGKDDVFYHLGCGDGKGVEIAVREFNVKKGIGIDNNLEKINEAKNISGEFICEDIKNSKIYDATVILFWFTDEEIIKHMIKKFEKLKPGTKIVTIWGPLPDCLPEKVNFPYIINTVPFNKAKTLQEQVLAVFGVKCVDFVTAWEFAERYTKAIGDPQVKNDRFLTIIQTLVIWINAKNLGVACREEIPESIKTYIEIMKMHFDIDFEHLLKE